MICGAEDPGVCAQWLREMSPKPGLSVSVCWLAVPALTTIVCVPLWLAVMVPVLGS